MRTWHLPRRSALTMRTTLRLLMAEITYDALMLVVKLHELRDAHRETEAVGGGGMKGRQADTVLEGL